jgi:hypothetical protein
MKKMPREEDGSFSPPVSGQFPGAVYNRGSRGGLLGDMATGLA